MSGPPVKRSLTLNGHRTSVSLEEPFWHEFRRIAAADGRAINDLAAEIDAARSPGTGLASAIRVFILRRALADQSSSSSGSGRGRDVPT